MTGRKGRPDEHEGPGFDGVVDERMHERRTGEWSMNRMMQWACLLGAVGMLLVPVSHAEGKPAGGKTATDILGILSLSPAESAACPG